MSPHAFNFELKHQKGKLNVVPDGLFRAPMEQDPKTESKIDWNIIIIDLQDIANSTDQNYMRIKHDVVNKQTNGTEYRIRKDILEKNVEGNRGNDWKILVPADRVEAVLKETHSGILAGHGRYWKTIKRTKQNFCWKGMKNDIKQYLQHCDNCKAVKPSNKIELAKMGRYRESKEPWQKIAVDYIGPLPRSQTGCKWILSIIDYFSNFVVLTPLRESTADATATAIEKDIFLKFGVPQYIICDNGVKFRSRTFAALLTKYCVKMNNTPNYHPQANLCEAANKTIGTIMKCYIEKDKHQKWDTFCRRYNVQ